MLDSQNSKEPVYAEYLEPAKAHLNQLILEIFSSIKDDAEQEERMDWFLKILNYYDSSSLLASIDRDKNDDSHTVSLKICLFDEYAPGENGFFLTFTEDEALNLVYKLKSEEYLALCEEGLLKMLNIYKASIKKDGHYDTYAADITMLQEKLGDVQTAAPNELENIFFHMPR